jgi:hypothetical protein
MYEPVLPSLAQFAKLAKLTFRKSGDSSQNGLANVGKSGEYSVTGLTNVGKSGESSVNFLANVSKSGKSNTFPKKAILASTQIFKNGEFSASTRIR